ncbi:MAG: DNA repair protein RadC [Flavobacteriales bacterium]|nr:DNA repair protein RadC [Flavobacteriales bacterium]
MPLKLTLRDLAEDDRPREKMMQKGTMALSDAELIAILIGSGNREETAVQLSQRVLNSYNHNLISLSKSSLKELQQFKGIGEAKAITIAAALELGRRRSSLQERVVQQISSSKSAYEILRAKLQDLPYEEFWVTFLSRNNKVLDTQMIGRGGISGTVADVRVILKMAIEHLASGIILAHNHPSGNLSPSNADMTLTHKVKESAKLMDIAVLDHLIITDTSYYSFADNGKI